MIERNDDDDDWHVQSNDIYSVDVYTSPATVPNRRIVEEVER